MNPSLSTTFTQDPSQINFHVLDISRPTSSADIVSIPVQLHSCTQSNASSIIEHVNTSIRARIISIEANSSVSALNISHELMAQIITRHNVEPEFWDVVQCFGDAPHAAESGCTQAFAQQRSDGSQACCYDLQYIQLNGRRSKPWSHRHTGIYHEKSADENGLDLIIMLHPTRGTELANRILSTVTEVTGECLHFQGQSLLQSLCEDPSTIHETLLDCTLGDWRPYLRLKGNEIMDRIDELATMDEDIQAIDEEMVGFNAVQDFRDQRDQILTATALCRGTTSVLELLAKSYPKCHFQGRLVTLHDRIRGHLSGLDTLRLRIENALGQLEYALGVKHQVLAKLSNSQMKELSMNTLELTQLTVKDSATVRTITVLGLLFLPGTFVSGLFGMNFFDFDDDSDSMVIASNFWIYAILWAVFTSATFIIYVLIKSRQKRPRLRKPAGERNKNKFRGWLANMSQWKSKNKYCCGSRIEASADVEPIAERSCSGSMEKALIR